VLNKIGPGEYKKSSIIFSEVSFINFFMVIEKVGPAREKTKICSHP